jgi:lipopolysaccharide export system protein LptA
MEGQAQQIEYDARKEAVRFSQQAVLRRVRAGVVTDEISGQVITYDNMAETFEVLGSGAPASLPASAPSARVRGVLAPRDVAPEKPSAGGDRR